MERVVPVKKASRDETCFSAWQSDHPRPTFRALFCTGCLLLTGFSFALHQSALANADLEAELFGAPSDAGETSDGDQENETREETPVTSPAAEESTTENSATLRASPSAAFMLASSTAVGGRADFTALLTRRDDEALSSMPISAQPSAYLYLDSRPRADTRGYLRLLLRPSFPTSETAQPGAAPGPSPSSASGDKLELLEAWMKWQPLGGRIFWTIGRQPIKWGSGTIWNPADFLSLEPKNPLSFFDDRGGSDALRAQIPFEDWNANISLVAAFPSRPRVAEPTIRDVTFAARAEIAQGASEWAATLAWSDTGPTRFGLDASGGLGTIDIDVEAACIARPQRQFFKRVTPLAGQSPAVHFESHSREGVCLPQALAGLSWEAPYGDSDSVTVGAEYFWNEIGHEDALLQLVAALSGNGTPLYLAKRYVGGYLFAPAPFSADNWSFQFTYLKNLSDFSDLYRATASVSVLENSQLAMGLTLRNGLGEFHLDSKDIETVLGPAALGNDLTELTRNSTPDLQMDATFSVNL